MNDALAERMAPIWEAAYEALRTDIGTLEDLARAAAKARRPDPEKLNAIRV